jgi:hypothetical protein
MKTVIADLRGKLQSERMGEALELEVFDLLLAACSACCTKYTGGNESCPPKATEIAG